MTNLREEDIDKLSKLCRIECTAEEKKKLLGNLSKVLSYVELLSEVDTTDVPPCNYIHDTMTNVLREDEVGSLLSREQFLNNAPAHTGGMIRVPPVIKF